MTVFAIVTLAVWAVGIISLALAVPHMARHDPLIGAAFTVNPVAAAAMAAICTVFWPAAIAAAGLVRLAARWQR